MNNFVDALKSKLSELNDERQELMDAVMRVDSKLSVISELLLEETGEPVSEDAPTQKKPREKKSTTRKATTRGRKKKVDVERDAEAQSKYQEAVATLPKGATPTTKEEQDRAVSRFNPSPRVPTSYGGVRSGGKIEEVLDGKTAGSKADTKITIEEE